MLTVVFCGYGVGVAREYVTQSISFSPSQLAAARARADSLGLSLSQYVQVLVMNDILLRRPLRILSAEDVDSELQQVLLAKRTAALQDDSLAFVAEAPAPLPSKKSTARASRPTPPVPKPPAAG